MKIAFIGLGIMGSRMAANLLHAGYDLTLHNRTPDKAAPLLDLGAHWADSPAGAAQGADVLITMLAHPQAVKDAATRLTGFLNAMTPGTLWIDSSTVNPSFSRDMAALAAERDIHFLDAPVAGSKGAAADAQLLFIVGGADEDVQTATPLFDVMGRQTIHAGSVGAGSSMKVVFNHMLAVTMAGFAEGAALAEALGIPQQRLFDLLMGGPVVTPAVGGKREKMESGDYEVEFPLRWMQKDLQMTATTAYEVGVPMPLSNAAKELYQMAIREGYGDLDYSAIYAFLRDDSSG